MKGKSEKKTYLQNKHSARFFAEEFIISFGMKALSNDPDMDNKCIPQLRSALKKMQEAYFKSKKKVLKPLPKRIKCLSLKCKSGGNLDNKKTDKYAQCDLCEGCEHFNCASIKDDRKLQYISGLEKFVC